MDLWTIGLVSILLLGCAAALMFAHVRTWRQAVGAAATREELNYRRRQFRRRMQTSAMLALLAVALFLGEWLTGVVESGWFGIIYWLGVLAVVIWVALLALADVLATKFHYDRLRRGYLIERAKLEAELRRIRRAQGNGRSGSDSADTK